MYAVTPREVLMSEPGIYLRELVISGRKNVAPISPISGFMTAAEAGNAPFRSNLVVTNGTKVVHYGLLFNQLALVPECSSRRRGDAD
jgi:hypothetical protein